VSKTAKVAATKPMTMVAKAKAMTAAGVKITPQGLEKAVKDGRVAKGATVEESIRSLAANTKPLSGGGDRRSAQASKGIDTGSAASQAASVASGATGDAPKSGLDMQTIRTRREALKLRGEQLDLEERQLNLVDRKQMVDLFAKFLREISDQQMNMSQKIAPDLAGMTDVKKIQTLMNHHARKCMEAAYQYLGSLPPDYKPVADDKTS
jgi:hypothetical protein